MHDKPVPFSQSMLTRGLVIISILFFSLWGRSTAQITNDFTNSEERELYETIPGQSKQETILDATNPMELMNRLRAITAMDDATSPSDAIDEALRSFEAQKEFSQPLQ